jgi:hypothetical protein
LPAGWISPFTLSKNSEYQKNVIGRRHVFFFVSTIVIVGQYNKDAFIGFLFLNDRSVCLILQQGQPPFSAYCNKDKIAY